MKKTRYVAHITNRMVTASGCRRAFKQAEAWTTNSSALPCGDPFAPAPAARPCSAAVAQTAGRRYRGSLVGAAMTAVLLAVFSGCSRAPAKATKGAVVPVLAATALEKDVPVQVRAIGNVTPISRVTVRSQLTGQLQGVHFKEGQEVRRDDLLFTIDPRPSEAALDQARANLARDAAQLENAKVAYERTKQLFESKFASQEDFDNARAAMDALQGTVLADRAAITNAALNLDYCRILSPVDGVTGAQLVFAGNIVKSPDDPMVVINQIHPIYVAFAVPERYLTEIRRELREQPLKVSATFDGLKGPAPRGEVVFVDNTVDTTTGTIQLKAAFANADSVLWPGQFVQVEMALTEVPHAVVVPNQAIQTGQNGDYVFVVKSDQTVEMRAVKSGESFDGETAVTGDLKAGETVVTDGQLNLVPGRTVNIKPPGTGGEAKKGQE
jgi:membrane fusion protein, multidrug efflux system